MGISEADNEKDVEVVTEQAWRQEVDHELSEDEELEYAERLATARKREAKLRKLARGHVRKKPVSCILAAPP